MVQKVFWENPYQTELLTTIKTREGRTVSLDSTIFYAFSGGQESDTGTIGGVNVLSARKEGWDIYYELAEVPSFKPGDEVLVKIDWERRYLLMRLHFAAEIILELCYSTWPGIEKIGAHISQDKARIDFLWEESLAPFYPKLLEAYQNLVDQNLPIISAFSDEEQQRRYWKIDGFGQVPCGGTHLRSTGELGPIKLKRKNIGKGKERIEIRFDR
ncbi:alanyl-tRNA editing protein [Spirochaeta cellobiosiphila]|uniref:alanyl-tRNA editing protein n=1 Tax=Spirochaeta cellobiosiphila TaxID=504483 RepID=UPI00040AD02C|nr:alanyl-tRNA editing protein [Spirochaeta cellobiosiphila]